MFILGTKSKANLTDVHPTLIKIVEHAITLSTQDFTVFEGVRTLAHQKKLVASRASRTLKSMHILQADGFGHAVDLVPWVDGGPRWEWGAIWPIAIAMQAAAKTLGHAGMLCWGGVWDRWMADYTDPKAAVTAYSTRHPGPDFLDGPHFQLARLG